MSNNKISNLWKKEDWLAVWIGFIVIAVACIAVLTGSFDFSAAKFGTWHWWENVEEKKSLAAQFNGDFWIKLLRTFLVTGVLFGIGIKLQGEKIKKFIPAYVVLFIICILVRMISAEYTLKMYLEWAFWALLIGLLISNTVGTPEWLRPAIRTEFYIKTGLVIMGFSVLFSNIAKFGLYGLGIAWIVTPIVIIFMWWLGTKVLKIDNKPLVITLASATSVCGTSAAIATGAAAKAKKEDLSLAISISIIFTILMMVFEPMIIRACGMNQMMGGALIGGTVDSTGAVVLAPKHPHRFHRFLRGHLLRHQGRQGPEPKSRCRRNLDPFPEVHHRFLRGFTSCFFHHPAFDQRRCREQNQQGCPRPIQELGFRVGLHQHRPRHQLQEPLQTNARRKSALALHHRPAFQHCPHPVCCVDSALRRPL